MRRSAFLLWLLHLKHHSLPGLFSAMCFTFLGFLLVVLLFEVPLSLMLRYLTSGVLESRKGCGLSYRESIGVEEAKLAELLAVCLVLINSLY